MKNKDNKNETASDQSKDVQSHTKLKWAGAIAITAAGAAGAYYFYGSKDAKQHREKAIVWMKNAEEEIMAEVYRLKESAFTNENYQKIVATIAEKYQALKNADPEDIREFVKNLNLAWDHIKAMKESGKKAVSHTKAVAHKKTSTPMKTHKKASK